MKQEIYSNKAQNQLVHIVMYKHGNLIFISIKLQPLERQ